MLRRIRGAPAILTEAALIAVGILIALVEAQRLVDRQRVIVACPVLKAAAGGKGRVAGDRAHQDVLAVERIVIAEELDLLDVAADHVADGKRIRVLIDADIDVALTLRFADIRELQVIGDIELGILTLLEEILVVVALVKDILDAEQAVRKRRVSVISGIVAAAGITHCFDELQDLGIHDGAGVRQTAETEARVVIDGSRVGFFCAVEGRILCVDPVDQIAAGLDVLPVGFSGGVRDIPVNIVEFAGRVVGQLTAADTHQRERDIFRHSSGRVFAAQHIDESGVDREEDDRHPDRLEGVDIFALLALKMSGIRKQEQHKIDGEHSGKHIFLDVPHIFHRHGRHGEQHEREDEGIAEGQPVRHLSAVPEHIDRAAVHADDQRCHHHAEAEFLSQRDAAVHEEQRQAEERQHTAVDLRHTLHIDGVVAVDAELREELKRLELCLEGIIRLCEVEFAELQRVVDRQDHERRQTYDRDGRDDHAEKDLQNLFDIHLHLVRDKEGIEGEVDRREDAEHEADVEVCHTHQRERTDVIELSAVIDKILDAERDQRQENKTVQPHRVDRLDDAVGAHAEHRAEEHGGQRRDVPRLAQIVAEGQRGRAQLREDHNEQRTENHGTRQQNDQKRERAGQIITDDALIAAGEVSGPVVKDTAVSVEGVADRFKVVDILSVQVEAENGIISERIQAEDRVRDIDQYDRQEECREVRPVAGKPSLCTAALCRECARRRCRDTCCR